jgi:NAD(P)-dependent dehydrogenase (short-subunit alcohol dehydrogenase family)
MKRHETNNKQAEVQRPSLERPYPGTAVVRKAEEQLSDELIMSLCKWTGTHSDEVANRIICQALGAQVWPESTDVGDSLTTAAALIREMAPQNATEAMLSVQMIATNDAALMFIRRSTSEDQSTEVIDANVLRATRLMRLFIQQTEAMQKLKGKACQQTLTVEQVNVHQGGHAIVRLEGSSNGG